MTHHLEDLTSFTLPQQGGDEDGVPKETMNIMGAEEELAAQGNVNSAMLDE